VLWPSCPRCQKFWSGARVAGLVVPRLCLSWYLPTTEKLVITTGINSTYGLRPSHYTLFRMETGLTPTRTQKRCSSWTRAWPAIQRMTKEMLNRRYTWLYKSLSGGMCETSELQRCAESWRIFFPWGVARISIWGWLIVKREGLNPFMPLFVYVPGFGWSHRSWRFHSHPRRRKQRTYLVGNAFSGSVPI